MISVWFWLVVGTIGVQIPNLLGINAGAAELKWADVMRISLYTLPITFLATAAFIYFYGKGSEYFSYPALTIYGKVVALAVAVLIQVWWLGSRETNWVEITGLILAVAGLMMSVYAKPLQHFFERLFVS